MLFLYITMRLGSVGPNSLQVIPEKEARVIVAQIFQGLAYLNQDGRRIIHYDLKPGQQPLFPECQICVHETTST
jgi:serine/threonine protein kinase